MGIEYDELEIYLKSVKKKGRVMESGVFCLDGEKWQYKVKKIK